ncbi:hypothetical protein FJ489_17140 [Mesorhizobium sp. B2-5-12]|nr:hypothetical protein FJ489_17140 [Mesorhizobium sp. B2-5-12]TPK24891.1 hypothetical protein FJ562_17395 [Mesorhizobium sp. B2-5-6]
MNETSGAGTQESTRKIRRARVGLPYCPTALLPYCPTALLPYCPTPPQSPPATPPYASRRPKPPRVRWRGNG